MFRNYPKKIFSALSNFVITVVQNIWSLPCFSFAFLVSINWPPKHVVEIYHSRDV